MSAEDTETLRAFIRTWKPQWTLEAWERGEVMDMSFVASDVIYEDAVLPDHVGEPYRGHEGWLRAARTWIEPFEWLRLDLEEIIDAGDSLISLHRVRFKARHTGIEFDSRAGDAPSLAYLWTLRNGEIVHLQAFAGPEEAFEVAGLSE